MPIYFKQPHGDGGWGRPGRPGGSCPPQATGHRPRRAGANGGLLAALSEPEPGVSVLWPWWKLFQQGPWWHSDSDLFSQRPDWEIVWLHLCLPSQDEHSLSFKILHLSWEGPGDGARGFSGRGSKTPRTAQESVGTLQPPGTPRPETAARQGAEK